MKIEFKNVNFNYDNDVVFSNLNLEIKEGEFVGLVGNNGTGKSTIIKLIAGIVKAKSGEIFNDFHSVGYLSQVNINKRNSFSANVREIVSLGLKKKPFSFMTKKDYQKVDDILQKMGIYELRNKRLDELSGGQQEKVRFAEVILSNPDLILLDEPTTGIDEVSKQEIKNILKSLLKEKKTIVMVSHMQEDFPEGCRFIDLDKEEK
jgi:zinc transport system ATP-binding protein